MLLDPNLPIQIPRCIAVCPYCDDTLLIESIDSITETISGLAEADSIFITCLSEPDVADKDEFDDWIKYHSDMPYVYMLPIEKTILKWLNAWHEFEFPEPKAARTVGKEGSFDS